MAVVVNLEVIAALSAQPLSEQPDVSDPKARSLALICFV